MWNMFLARGIQIKLEKRGSRLQGWRGYIHVTKVPYRAVASQQNRNYDKFGNHQTVAGLRYYFGIFMEWLRRARNPSVVLMACGPTFGHGAKERRFAENDQASNSVQQVFLEKLLVTFYTT